LLQNEQFLAAHEVLSAALDRNPAFIFDSLQLVSLKMKLGRLEEAEKILNIFNDSPSVSAQSLGLSIVLAQGQNQTAKKLHWGKLLGLRFSNSAQWRAYQEGTLND
jgi:Tfp pilus assembly protein PilF